MRTHPHTHTEKTQGVLRQGPVNPSEAEVCHGTGQCQSPWTRGVGWFHGTLDINAPPRLEVNNSAHSITCTGMCPHTHTHTFTPPSPLHSEYGVIWMVGLGKSPFNVQRRSFCTHSGIPSHGAEPHLRCNLLHQLRFTMHCSGVAFTAC